MSRRKRHALSAARRAQRRQQVEKREQCVAGIRRERKLASRRQEAERFEDLRKASSAGLEERLEASGLPWQADLLHGARFKRLAVRVRLERPRLLNGVWLPVLWGLASAEWLRPLEDWRASGRGSRQAVRSLVDHLFVRYPVPAFLGEAFLREVGRCGERVRRASDAALSAALVAGERGLDPTRTLPFFRQVAAGGSPYDCVKTGLLPARLTRQMCAALMASPAGLDFLPAVRRAQVIVLGGGGELARAAGRCRLGREYLDDEEFAASALHWFCRQEGLTLDELDPLLDYLCHRRAQDPCFGMKGRSLKALRRDTQLWHRELAAARRAAGAVFPPSGLAAGIWTRQRRVNEFVIQETIWSMEEILCARELLNEGRIQHHCVVSYAHRIEERRSSVWSLRCEDVRRLTIEVDLTNRVIVQARGKYNSAPQALEAEWVRRWARENRLRIQASGISW